jgi:glycosyltransferase involved in cell wall biosynthesis
MAQGIPPIVTPTRTNAAIVRDGVEGLHADSDGAWSEAVQRLLDDERLWQSLSSAAHARALSDYSTHTWGPRLAVSLKTLVRR